MADPCRLCQFFLISLLCSSLFSFFFQQHSIGAQVVQRGAIQQDNYSKNLTNALWACKRISPIISLLARIFNNCNSAFFSQEIN